MKLPDSVHKGLKVISHSLYLFYGQADGRPLSPADGEGHVTVEAEVRVQEPCEQREVTGSDKIRFISH